MSYHSKNRNKNRNKSYLYFLISFIYIFGLWLFWSREIILYFLVLSPAFILIMLSDIYREKKDNWQKGIDGENKVEKVLSELGVEYERNFQIDENSYDYDFIVFLDKRILVLEVKNLTKLSNIHAKEIYNKLKHRAAILHKHLIETNEGKDIPFVEPVVVCTGVMPKSVPDGMSFVDNDMLNSYFKS